VVEDAQQRQHARVGVERIQLKQLLARGSTADAANPFAVPRHTGVERGSA
jgi:hypothetical protein